MQGTVRLARGGAQSGSLRALGPLARTALAVPPGPVLPWQAVVRGLRVPLPRMLGTAGTGHAAPGGPPAPSFAPVPATAHAPAHTASGSRLLAVLLTLLLAGLALLVWRRPAWPARRRALAAPAGEGVVAGPATDVARST